MTNGRTYRVKELARLAGVSVRTLHHYDEIGLLVPSSRTAAGYRIYKSEDVLRLQQILIERELGMPLEEIKRALDSPDFDRRSALERQREEIVRRAERYATILRAIDAALAALAKEKGVVMNETNDSELTALFDGFDPLRHESEVKKRWGETDAFKESARRTAGYTERDWAQYKVEAEAIMTDAARRFRANASAESEESMRIAERHRQSIDRWFYPCAATMHVQLADMYEADARFAKDIDRYAPGLTAWLAAAIRANARK